LKFFLPSPSGPAKNLSHQLQKTGYLLGRKS
jgi:hypothetical protein